MIERQRIEAIKRDVDLAAIVRAKGVKLRKNGKSYFGLCPFHDDHNPSFSVNPTNNLWQCFGRGAGGDVIRFVELFDQVDFKEAVRRLSDNGFKSLKRSAKKKQPARQSGLSAKLLKLLKRVIDFYHTAFCEDPRARQYLNQRGITDNTIFSDFKIGFANATLLNALPGEGDVYEQLKQIGVLSEKGHEHFYGYVTFPLYDLNGNPAGIYGRRLDEMVTGNVADHLYLPGARHGLFNRQAVKVHKEIILTESIIDSLTLINVGIKNTMFYKDKDSLKHKILAIEELDDMNGAVYSIRSIQSAKKITIAYTGKDPVTGELKTQDNTVEGPLMVFITTTQVDIDGETASRFVFISIDESEEMTQKILVKQQQSQTMEGMINKIKSAEIIKKHQDANHLLKPLCVFNPYADLLTFTSKSLRARRDHTKYLNLILAITYLFQYQRKARTMDYSGKTIEYINVTLADIDEANRKGKGVASSFLTD